MPIVSVIVPTKDRPKQVLEAVRSVLGQTMADLELIVVVDGADPAAVASLERSGDPRLRIIVNPHSQGAASARNAGVDVATAEWVAFLDDDDEWLPTKLEKQLAVANASRPELLSCLSRVLTPNGSVVWPTKIYDRSQSIDAYLFNQRSLFMGSSFIQTSSYLLRRDLFQQVRFRPGTEPHDDWDFLIRIEKVWGATIVTVPEPLVLYRFQQNSHSLSKTARWRASLDWIDSLGELVTPPAHAGFCLGVAGASAANARDFGSIRQIFRHAFQRGTPSPLQLARFAAFWVLPADLRRKVRAFVQSADRSNAEPREDGLPPPQARET